MAAFELPLVALLSTVLTRVALLGRQRDTPSWVALFAPGAVAWIAGTQGLLFRRQPDYMVAYLFEARDISWVAYLTWCAAALGLAFGFSRLTLRSSLQTESASRVRWVLVGLAALLIGLLALPLVPRLKLIGSTFEFREGVARPLDYQPAVRTLLILTGIGSLVPLAGTMLLVTADGIRSVLRSPSG